MWDIHSKRYIQALAKRDWEEVQNEATYHLLAGLKVNFAKDALNLVQLLHAKG